ncbi:SMP-30/gluconolactonase/LRE family protein [Labrys monachus]|uniref:Sugar lactone lactonase YvrE n=1 Tax=Labrys monachus TaxID=217067 RepID=A0ABU0FJV7_9HYPH|nr:SMP-30/gluconolactonase/LRE family protein [Labrys monachus]MDQ0394894.1 sugar lactone lactonase YvrE [Labrys monachus]
MTSASRPGSQAGPSPRVIRIGREEVTEHLTGLQAAECPFWDGSGQDLWLVDMAAPSLIRLHPETGEKTVWPMPEAIGSFALCETDGKAIVALAGGLFILDLGSGALRLFARPEPEGSENRLNDGKASPEGRFWVGGMNLSTPRRAAAGLFRIDPDGAWTRVLDGIITSNGLAWSADGRRMFHSDSRGETLRSFDYEPATGDISGARTLARLSDSEGRPDGGTIDAEGCYWSAGASASCLNRFAADGTLAERYILPVAAPSMLCFGGPDFDRIFVTSLSVAKGGVTETGRVISFPAPVRGLAGHRFRLEAPP